MRFDTHDAGIQAMVIIGSQTVGCTDQKLGAGTLVRLEPVDVGELAYRYTITGKSPTGAEGSTWDVCVSLNGLEQDEALIQIPDSRYDVAKADHFFAALGCVPKNG